MTINDIIKWWDDSTQEEKYELLTKLGSDNVSDYVWYVYPEMTKEHREELAKKFEEWKSKK